MQKQMSRVHPTIPIKVEPQSTQRPQSFFVAKSYPPIQNPKHWCLNGYYQSVTFFQTLFKKDSLPEPIL